MKSITKQRTAFLAILGFTLLSSFLLYLNLDLYSRDSHKYPIGRNDFYFNISNLQTSKISGKIHINNNWTDAKSAGICNGSGTWNDPYLIKDLIIDGKNSSNCIRIQNSSVYFKIENCTLFNAGSDWSSEYAGILLEHTNNGIIIDNNCSKNMYGISLVLYSSNNTIYRNHANENFYTGIALNTFCNNNTVYRNFANSNSVFGISISWNSHNNTVSKNNATRNIIGLEISSFSKFNKIIDNNFSYNTFPGWSTNGIRISRAENNSITRNIVKYNGWEGIQVYESNYNFFLNNSIINNGDHGISLIRCDENRFFGNNISLNGQYGVNIEESKSNLIKFNTINSHVVGIYLDDQSRCNIVLNNFFSGNGADILNHQRTCEEIGLTPPPINIVFISLTIIGITILITGAVLVLRSLLRIKMKNR